MKKFKLILVFIIVSSYCFGQENESSTSIFISQAKYYQINKDWNIIAEFNTGTGDNAKFFPIEVIDLKTMEKQRALQIDMYVKTLNETHIAYVGYDEIGEFINFLELHVIPNMETKYKKKSSEYRFIGKEMVFSYLTNEKNKTVTIVLKKHEYGINDEDRPKFQFFAESQSDEIIKLLTVLKILA